MIYLKLKLFKPCTVKFSLNNFDNNVEHGKRTYDTCIFRYKYVNPWYACILIDIYQFYFFTNIKYPNNVVYIVVMLFHRLKILTISFFRKYQFQWKILTWLYLPETINNDINNSLISISCISPLISLSQLKQILVSIT